MQRRQFIQLACGTSAAIVLSGCVRTRATKPNIVLIVADDLGFGDLGCYGSALNHTPRLDRLAREGCRFTDFHVASAMCTPSRAALLTGSYPQRVGFSRLPNEIGHVLLAHEIHGLHPDEVTLADMLKEGGYATKMVGKWHLGDHPSFMPTRQGFDSFFGLPYSHDIAPDHPNSARFNFPPLPLYRNEEVVEINPDRRFLTQRFTAEAAEFVREHKASPFFLYFAHTLPHDPHLVPASFLARSRNGAYGACVELIDQCTGLLLDALAESGLEGSTLVIFTSDHGNAATEGRGSNGPLRAGKGNTWEGGMRVPCLMRWPVRIPAGSQCDVLATTMDLLPTLAGLAATSLPRGGPIDGKDIWPLMSGPATARTPYDVFLYLWMDELHAVRSGPWKLVVKEAHKAPFSPARLYNLDEDPGEEQDLAALHLDIVRRLQSEAQRAREELGDAVTGTRGRSTRPLGIAAWPSRASRHHGKPPGNLTVD